MNTVTYMMPGTWHLLHLGRVFLYFFYFPEGDHSYRGCAPTAKPTNETPSRRVDFIGELQLRIPNSELKLEFLDLLKRQAGVLGT